MNYLKGDVVLLPYPFTDLTTKKVRPGIVISSNHGKYEDVFIVPLTSKILELSQGEFILTDWKASGLNVQSAVKRGCVLIDVSLIKMKVGTLEESDIIRLNRALKIWFEID